MVWNAYAAFGSTAAANNLTIDARYSDGTGYHEAHANQYLAELTAVANERKVFATTGNVVFPMAGTYYAGLFAGDIANSGHWNSNDWYTVTVSIFAAGTPNSASVEGTATTRK